MTAASSQSGTSKESLSDPARNSSWDEKPTVAKHNTNLASSSSPTSASPARPTDVVDLEKAAATEADATHHNNDSRPARHPSSSSRSTSCSSSYNGAPVKAGRPDTATLIREAVSGTPSDGRVLVAACGPAGLMRTVRDTTASLIRGDGPAVELHCEEFGW